MRPRSALPAGSSSVDRVVGFTPVGLLAAGAVGLVKVMGMTTGMNVLCCLIGSATAFGAVTCGRFRKR